MEQLPPHERSRGHQRVAEALAALDRPPGRVAHHYLAAGLASRAVPYVVRAVEIAGALGAFRDALALVDGVREHAGPEHLPVLLSRRADLLMALGDPGAVEAYAEAARVTTGTLHRLVRARLARAAAIGGDLATARSALAGPGPPGRRGRRVAAARPGHPGVLHRRHGDRAEGRGRGSRAAARGRRPMAPGRPGGPAGAAGAPAWGVVLELPHRAATYAGTRAPGRCRLRRPPVRGGEPALRPRALCRDHRRGRAASAAAPARPAPCGEWPSPPPSSGRRRS